jgi:hypothetical protein
MLLAKANRIPPKLCRLLAREGRRPLTLTEISTRSGIKIIRLRSILELKSWGPVPIEDADRIMKACGVDPFNMRRTGEYLKRQAVAKKPFSYLNNARLKGYYARIMEDLSK